MSARVGEGRWGCVRGVRGRAGIAGGAGRARARARASRARDLSRSSTTFRANDAYWTGKRAGARPAREAGRDPRARRTSVVLLVVGLHAVHRGEERPEGDDEREHRQRHERVPHLSASVKSHATCASDFVPSLPNPSPRSTRPNHRACRCAASTISPSRSPAPWWCRSRPPGSVDSVISFCHGTRRVASRAGAPEQHPNARKGMPARPVRDLRHALVVSFAPRSVREPSLRAARSSPARSNLTSGIERRALLIADQISEIKTGARNPSRVFSDFEEWDQTDLVPVRVSGMSEQRHHATTRFSRLFPPLLLSSTARSRDYSFGHGTPSAARGCSTRAFSEFDPASEARPRRGRPSAFARRALGGRRPARPPQVLGHRRRARRGRSRRSGRSSRRVGARRRPRLVAMPRSDYLEILDEAEALEKSGAREAAHELVAHRLGLAPTRSEVGSAGGGTSRRGATGIRLEHRRQPMRTSTRPERVAAAEAEQDLGAEEPRCASSPRSAPRRRAASPRRWIPPSSDEERPQHRVRAIQTCPPPPRSGSSRAAASPRASTI